MVDHLKKLWQNWLRSYNKFIEIIIQIKKNIPRCINGWLYNYPALRTWLQNYPYINRCGFIIDHNGVTRYCKRLPHIFGGHKDFHDIYFS